MSTRAVQGWLLITVSLSSGQASLRVHVRRKLRSLGAVYLQSSVCLVPERADVSREVRRLLDRVQQEGGAGQSLRIVMRDAEELQWLHEQFNTARDIEYGEVLERLPSLSAELASERAKGRTTYAEVEESEADLDRFRSWMAKIERRDYFAAPLGAQARAAVSAAAQELATFEAEALHTEAPPELRRLRAVPAAPRRRRAAGPG